MAARRPFISVVVPTRNRPELVGFCLESLTLQRFSDFEVIVSDNHTGKPCKDVYDRYADQRFKYVTPSIPLAMHDNWEFACGLASGEYVCVLIDKTVFRPSALQKVSRVLEEKPTELISWRSDFYDPLDVNLVCGQGCCRPAYPSRTCYYFDPREELERRFRLDVRRGQEGVNYFWGKICFGAYRQSLIQRIRSRLGRLFYPIAPDYTSMIAALASSDGALDIGQSLIISMMTTLSNGRLYAEQDAYARHFLEALDPSLVILDTMPLKGLYASTHNVVARDYITAQQRLSGYMPQLNLTTRNLILRAREDLNERQTWQNPSQRTEQYRIWQTYFNTLSLPDKAYVWLQLQKGRVPRVKPVVKAILNHFPGMGKALIATYRRTLSHANTMTFSNIIEAAKHTDDSYDASGHRSIDG